MRRLILLAWLGAWCAWAQYIPPGGGGSPAGAAGGDLGGTYPNPTVTSGAHLTSASVPVAALAATSTSINSTACALGSTCTVAAVPSGTASGVLAGSYPSPTFAGITAAGDMVAGNTGTGAAVNIPPNTSTQSQVLTMVGTGTAGQLPSWQPPAAVAPADASITPIKMAASTFDVQGTTGSITWAIGSILSAQATTTFTTHTSTATLNVTNPVIGGNYVWKLIQDATGGITATLGTGCTWLVANGGTPSGAHVITLTNAANAVDVLVFQYDGTNCLTNVMYNLKP